MDKEIFSKRFEVERKIFFLDFKENPSGRFLKITEKSGERRNFITIPESGLTDLVSVLEQVVEEKNKLWEKFFAKLFSEVAEEHRSQN